MSAFCYRLVSFVAILVLIFCNSCNSILDEQLKLLEEAHNSHDIERLLSFYTDDARFVLVDGWIAEGKDKLRERFEWDFAMHGSLHFFDYQINQDTITCQVEERNDFFTLLDIDVVNYEYSKFIFADGLIREIQAKVSQQSIETIDNALSDFMIWATAERTLELEELMADGNLLFTADKAEKWMILLQTYRITKILNQTEPASSN